MKHTVTVSRDMEEEFDREYERGEKAVTAVMRGAAREIKQGWRDEIAGAGLGRRLGQTVRGEAYPKGDVSMNAAALIWTKAPKIVSAHETGPVINSKDGFWLAIPLPAAGRGRFGRRMTPGEFEQRVGKALRFVYLNGRRAYLVMDDARLNKTGKALNKRGRRRKKDGILTGAQTVPIFLLVPQVRLAKRLNLLDSANKIAATIPSKIAAIWED